MRTRLQLLAALIVLLSIHSNAQMVGTSIFMQGRYLEIGEIVNGAFGTSTSPAGYHPHPGWGTGIAEVYDYGHDGWAVGAPPFMGDYTLPGFPTEGWSLQVNGLYNIAFQAGGFPGTGTLTGATTTYTNVGGRAIGNWTGTAAGGTLAITQETRVDTQASWVVVTTKLKNTTGAPILNVFYERTCDPDNDESWPGGSFMTTNTIVHQNDADHRVQVSATGPLGLFTYMALGTKDCRAKCFVCQWGLTPITNLSDLYNQTGGASGYTYSGTYTNDVGYGIVWNIGTIGPNDSTAVSYAYIFNGDNGIDSALPDPVLTIGGTTITSYPDTLNACAYPGIDSLPIDILYGEDKDWTWGSWTWTPSTGLSSTTGAHVYVKLNAVPGNITYTVSGTDSLTGMKDCANRQFVFTVHSCHFAWANSPCEGDALTLGMLGDSLGATYFWYGPGGFTSYLHDPIIFPCTLADSGLYHVVRTIGGVADTDYAYVTIHPLPVVTPASSIAPCGAFADTLFLTCNLDSIGESFSWTGPGGYTSQLQDSFVAPFDSSLQGTYVVTGTTIWGCHRTSSVDVYLAPVPHFFFAIHHGCSYDTVLFFDNTYNASTYIWTDNNGDTIIGREAMHVYPATTTTIYDVRLSTTNAHCSASFDTLVDTRHSVLANFWPTPDTFCLGLPITFVNTSTTSITDPAIPPANPADTMTFIAFAWDFGNGVTDTVREPNYTYDACGRFDATLTVTDSIGCTSSSSHWVNVIKLNVSSFTDTTLCISMPLPMTNVFSPCPTLSEFPFVPQFVWTQNTPNLSDTSIQNPTLSGLGLFVDTLTITYPGVPGPGGTFGCAVIDTVKVDAVMGAALTDVTASATISLGGTVYLNASNEVYYNWVPNDGSLSNPNISNPIATPTVTTTYTVYGLDGNGCLDSASVTIYVDSSMPGDIPSAFSPNNDGLNDVWHPVGMRFGKLVEARVYNRWGEDVFYSNSKEVGWDGTYHGVPQDMGVYFYQVIIAAPGGQNLTYKGTVTLIR